MGAIYDRVKRDVEYTLERVAEEEANDRHLSEDDYTKTISLRLGRHRLFFIDHVASMLGESRQGFLDELIADGVNDAIDAWCDAHGDENSEAARKSFMQGVKAGMIKEGLLEEDTK